MKLMMQMCINSRNRGVNQNTFAFLRAATVFFSSLARTICSHLQRFFLYSFSSVFYCVFSKILPFQAFGSSFFFFWNQKHSQSTPIPFCCCEAQSKNCLYLDMFKASSKIHLKWMALSMHANLELMQKRETNTIRYAYRCFFCTATEWNEGDENGVADRQSDKTSIYHRTECFYMQICP